MINVYHKDRKILLIPQDMESQNLLNKVFPGRAEYSFDDTEVRFLNKVLAPAKNFLKMDQSYLDWKNNVFNATKIEVGVITSSLVTNDVEFPHDAIDKATQYFFMGAQHVKSYQSGKWDGYIHLYKKQRSGSYEFPSGLLSIVLDVVRETGKKVIIEMMYDDKVEKQFDWELCDGLIADPDQIEAISAGVAGKRGILKAPTGFGKTDILAKRLIVAYGVPALFVANKKALLDDAAQSFVTGITGSISVDQIKDGWFGKTKLPSTNIAPLSAPIVVATIQSLHARLQDPKTRDILKHWLNNVCKFIMVNHRPC